jgi:hypothetical protein
MLMMLVAESFVARRLGAKAATRINVKYGTRVAAVRPATNRRCLETKSLYRGWLRILADSDAWFTLTPWSSGCVIVVPQPQIRRLDPPLAAVSVHPQPMPA